MHNIVTHKHIILNIIHKLISKKKKFIQPRWKRGEKIEDIC